MRATALSETIDARLSTLSIEEAATLRQNPRSTILPPEAPDSRQERALLLLQELNAGRTQPLRIQRTLGEGGMGIVHLAEQESMGRNVAVKTLRDGHRDHSSALHLLREAWVTGFLEHPNIVPVYDVAIDDTGAPQVVLKRIEGIDWATLLSDPKALRERAKDDVEAWNIRTLLQVCNAIAFAHDRGIIHRDLKPENVMIGQFGEVYVVDWGIAVSIRDDDNPRIPRASLATELAGTPAYMAPEMLTGDASALGERTDVYLLGAILFELVAGRPPHSGATLQELFQKVMDSEPELPEGVPSELSRTCRKAMARRPEDRHPSVQDFRRELSEYLDHRESMRLAHQAQRRANELLEDLSEGSDGEADRARIHHLFGECRFGFRAALEAWPENEVAAGGLRLVIKAMAKYELRHGNLVDARLLVGELGDAPPDLRKQLDALERRHAAETERHGALEELRAQLDQRTGSRTRTFVTTALGLMWTGVPIASHFALQVMHVAPSPAVSMKTVVGMLPVVLAFGYWGRESMGKTLVNRRFFALVVAVLLLQLLLGMAVTYAHLEPLTGLAMNFLLWCVATTVACITIDYRMWPSPIGYAIALFAALTYPGLILIIMGLSHAVLTVNLVLMWRPMFENFARSDQAR